MRTIIFALAALLFTATAAGAQTTNHWSTKEECLAATSAPAYHPTVIHRQALGREEFIGPLLFGSCLDMDLPEGAGKRGFVRIEAGRPVVYDRTGKLKRLAECDNDVHSVAPFPIAALTPGSQGLQGLQGPMGPQGPRGLQGQPGSSPAPIMSEKSNRFAWMNPKRKTGKIFWSSLAVGAVACAIECGSRLEVLQITRVRVTQ